ncbi:cobalamin biosynthesis protein [Calothrix sp. PCC 7507]|uniref:cobalamin biosynthesis protein n=1 Tax=Calothrix sp. PCC 7507 TaxID=99598 RepID=UPI00029EF97D|nr:cobalamin biosynthesis protein [Calothrix sp. PCC 7507]AFY31460.1 cobalamin (vitamin B12) biosynthesis CbiG protein [Calothrix sp. PCC 7507]
MNDQVSKLQCHRRFLWVGIGCQRGTSWQLMARAIQQVFLEHRLEESAIAGIATIDTKASEVGLVALCRLRHWPLKIFPAETLYTVSVPNPSQITAQVMGTPSVAEAAALCASLNLSHTKTSHLCAGVPSLEKSSAQRREGVNPVLLVPKQIFRLKGEPGTVTIAVAQVDILINHSQEIINHTRNDRQHN